MHELWYAHKQLTERSAVEGDTSIQGLLKRMFERMDPVLLSGTDSVGKDGSPLESCWEAEAYRVCVAATPLETVVSTQAGQVSPHQAIKFTNMSTHV